MSKAKTVLEHTTFPIALDDDKRIVFDDSNISVQEVISHLNQQDILINDMEIVRIGAEMRYLELFEGTTSL